MLLGWERELQGQMPLGSESFGLQDSDSPSPESLASLPPGPAVAVAPELHGSFFSLHCPPCLSSPGHLTYSSEFSYLFRVQYLVLLLTRHYLRMEPRSPAPPTCTCSASRVPGLSLSPSPSPTHLLKLEAGNSPGHLPAFAPTAHSQA